VHWNVDRITIWSRFEWEILISFYKGIAQRILWLGSMQILGGFGRLIVHQWVFIGSDFYAGGYGCFFKRKFTIQRKQALNRSLISLEALSVMQENKMSGVGDFWHGRENNGYSYHDLK
jgi:hypothetical protein